MVLTDRKTYNRTHKVYNQDITLMFWGHVDEKYFYLRHSAAVLNGHLVQSALHAHFLVEWFWPRCVCRTRLSASPHVWIRPPPPCRPVSHSVTESLPCHACVGCSVIFFFSPLRHCGRWCFWPQKLFLSVRWEELHEHKWYKSRVCCLVGCCGKASLLVFQRMFFCFRFSSNKTHLKHHYRQNKLSLASKTLWVVSF